MSFGQVGFACNISTFPKTGTLHAECTSYISSIKAYALYV